MNVHVRISLICLALIAIGVANGQAQSSLQQEFQSPPNTARPRVWWHWMNGNITKEGIQKDLEWMKRVGIGGFQNFDASLFTPVMVPKKLVFMTPEWKDAFKFTTDLASKLSLEMAIAGSPGWSVTGGPWVQSGDGMKKYVWSETQVTGGKAFAGTLPPPPTTTGTFQNVAMGASMMSSETGKALPTYYADAAVVAYRLPTTEQSLTALNPKITSSGGTFTLAGLTDGDLATTQFLPPVEVGKDMWIQYEFDQPQTVKAFSIVGASHTPLEEFNGAPENRALQVSDDGVTFRTVVPIRGSTVPQSTMRLIPTTARFFRVTFTTLPPAFNPFIEMAGVKAEAPKPEGVNVAELVLYNTDRVDLFEQKAGFSPWKESTHSLINEVPADAIPTSDVVDLTGKMTDDGKLNWDAPAGNWVIMRLGYTLTGRQNHPASPEATGLEVDKLDKAAVSRYIETYLDMYKDATGGQMGAQGLQYMVLDSYEAGHMTWTKDLPGEFSRRRGYDLRPWLPVLAGRVIQSAEASEKFLWDYRKTIGELIVENHYEAIGEALHKRGMKRYTESHENGRIYLADGMDVKRRADIPMAAMWTPGSLAGGADEENRSKADIREAASVAHIYGQNLVAAESMTSIGNAFSWHPEKLKRTADMELASGLNRFVIHTSVHQPLDNKKPGFSLGPFGQYFTRQETWAEPAKAWVDYLSRSSYLLQQGNPVVDILYYYGENNNITQICAEKLPTLPTGYEFDFANATVLREAIQAKNGRLVTPSGMTYRLLVLDSSARNMTMPVLKKIGELASAGIHVVGPKPLRSPSLSDDATTFATLANQIWSQPTVSTKPVAEVLKAMDVPEDVLVKNSSAPVLYVHRKSDSETSPRPNPQSELDIYWLNSRSENSNAADVSFRVTGKVPERWNPETGKTEKVSYRIENGRTIIPLTFAPWDACFIVFREKATITAYTSPKAVEKPILTVSSPWNVAFQAGRGASNTVTLSRLDSWTNNADKSITYFSGTAAYTQTVNVPAVNQGQTYVLDLGDVKNMAEVSVNGKNVGIVWKKPFRIDVTNALKAGANKLEVNVTNLWVNRLIGDAQAGALPTTFTTMPFYKADSPLLPSGLLGPVQLLSITR
ncbi:glycosyl hydrolase [Fibrella forsythiae]|uniref:Discoidin domain-containing protein n=1 Tax=Fibrella forsythiae TaxID=2817061 RepID=A0ABS3JR39_9BACT|nr:glycosyl hydrolase [Fibrella forsythiae]MBO0951913.1 discoidin domain-containing protein [Fibrella forsythiae]